MGETQKSPLKNNNIKSSVKENKVVYLSIIAFVLFTIFIFLQRWIDLVFKSTTIQIGLCLIVLALLLLRPRKNRMIILDFNLIDLLWVFAIILVQVYIIYAGVNEYNNQFFMYTIGIVFLILAKVDINKYKYSFLFIKYASIVCAFATIVHFLFTDLFHSIIFPLVPHSVQARTLELVSLNYYPGIGFAQPAIAAGYMLIGAGMIFSFWGFRNKFEKRMDVFYLIILLLGIIMVGKRSFILWGLITALVTYYTLSPRKRKVGRFAKLTFGIMIMLTL